MIWKSLVFFILLVAGGALAQIPGTFPFAFLKRLSSPVACEPGSISFGAGADLNSADGVYSFTVPSGCTSLRVKAWGAGGGSNSIANPSTDSHGGGGGFARGEISVTPGESLQVVIGSGGRSAGTSSYGYNTGAFGGPGMVSSHPSGGGYSGVHRGSGPLSQANALILAGGGGSGGTNSNALSGGAGGGYVGLSAQGTGAGAGNGGTALQGAAGTAATGGGGGGYVGGGAGTGNGGGGGGSSFMVSSATNELTLAGAGRVPGNKGDIHYAGDAGLGGLGLNANLNNTIAGQNGRVVLQWGWETGVSACNAASQNFSYTGAVQTLTVPAGCTSGLFKAWGAGGGGASYTSTSTGGGGGYAWSALTTVPGETLSIYVGGGGMSSNVRTGGWNGGGNGSGSYICGTGGGGGWSGVSRSSVMLLIAGGGGGAGCGNTDQGSPGGGLQAAPLTCDATSPCGGGETAGGTAHFPYATAGASFQGGQGASHGAGGAGGGGGGGYYGGGGGCEDNVRGGGGGSSFVSGTGQTESGVGSVPGGASYPERAGMGEGGAGGGSVGDGKHGLVFVRWNFEDFQEYVVFKESGTFSVPQNVSSVRVLCVGGGGGGASYAGGGGGSGLVAGGTYTVTPGSSLTVTVGAGGAGTPSGGSTNASNGQASSLGAVVTCAGGTGGKGNFGAGGAGGSGGGGSRNGGSGPGGAGGQNGANGITGSVLGGTGQGAAFSASFNIFTFNAVTAGAGGVGATRGGTQGSGGGGGGVLIGTAGPSAEDAPAQSGDSITAKGGVGYGAGGAGSWNYKGGDGAPGVIYIEW